MTGLEFLLPVLSLAGTALGAVGQIQAGQAQAQAAQAQAQINEQQARSERETAAVEAQDFRRSERRQIAAARATRLAQGVVLAGSPLLVDEDTVREVALGSSRLQHRGLVRGHRLDQEAELARARGSAAQTASYFNAGSSLLGGLTSFF